MSVPARGIPDAIVKLLAEEERATAVACLARRREEAFARLIYFRLAQYDEERARIGQSCLEQMDGAALERCLSAPAICEALRMRHSNYDIVDLLEAELAFQYREHLPGGRWTSLGDAWVGTPPPQSSLPLTRSSGRLLSPRLTCGIAIDLSLPPAPVRPSSGLLAPRPLTFGEMNEAVAKLNDAMESLEAAWPDMGEMVGTLTRSIVLRIDDHRPEDCWGASSGLAIGRTVLVNVHLATGQALAEHLIHEATHTALDIVELNAPLLDHTSQHADLSRVSPWTGQSLSLHAFVHAVAVWAVLHAYWSMIHASEPSDSYAAGRLRFISDGFARFNLDKLCADQDLVTPSALEMLRLASAPFTAKIHT